MVTTIFKTIAEQSSNIKSSEKRSRIWYRDQSSRVKKVNNNEIIDVKNLRSTLNAQNIGQMFMFFYNPKHKQTLPYYDMFPLVFPIELYSDGFLGLNLHYLPRNYRANLMDALYYTINNNKKDKTTRLRVTYQLLESTSRMRYFKPCVKRYLSGHVMQKFIYIDPENWDKALMLPTERFMKKPINYVHTKSINMLKVTI